MKMMEALTKRGGNTGQLVVHPAFRPGLAIGERSLARVFACSYKCGWGQTNCFGAKIQEPQMTEFSLGKSP